jgi:FkbM family methyltransferase
MISIKSCKHGIMAYNPNDLFVGKSLQEYGEFSEGEVILFQKICRPGMTVLDIGANIGVFSVIFGQLVGNKGNVLAFEPQRLPYYNLCTNILVNELTNVVCIQNVVGSENKRVHVPELNPNLPNNFGGLELDKDYSQVFGHSIKMVKIDDFNLTTCGLIKIDVEGMELDVLLGASQTIDKCRPIIYAECDRKDKATPLVRFIKNKGYKTLIHAPLLYNPDNHQNNSSNVFSNMASINLFAYPQEMECPINPDEFEMREVGKDKTLIVASGTPQDAIRSINETEHAILKGYCNIANSYAENLFDVDHAMSYLHKAIAMSPHDWRLYQQALPILSRFMKYEECLEYAEKAIELGGNIDVTFSKGLLLGCLEKPQEAIECYKEVLRFRPDCPETHFNMSIELLKIGQLEEGWKEYEYRFQRGSQALLEMVGFLPNKPKWNGEPIKGKRILLFIEQGSGDQIQFIRYVKKVKELGAHTIVACYPALEKLIQNVEGVDEIVVHGQDTSLPPNFDCDVMCSLMSLPRIFKTNLFNIPAVSQYIYANNPKQFQDLSQESLLVGICWAGSETHPMDFCRSCELRYFNNLVQPGLKFVNLQMSNTRRFWQHCGPIDLNAGSVIPMIDVREQIKDYSDTANLIHQLDLVITVDTSVAHLSAAMGKPTWILLGKNYDWRWLSNFNHSPWYPTVKLFRGKNWEDTFSQVLHSLQNSKIGIN